MNEVRKALPSSLPDAPAFRAWVQSGMEETGASATSISAALGLGKNTLSQFLAKPERSVSLCTASAVAKYLIDLAHLSGVDLPPLAGVCDV